MRKTCGFVQIAQKNCAKLKFDFSELSDKKFPGLRKLRKKIAQNSLRFIRKNSAKVRQKNCAKIAQILRKRFSHFLETLFRNTQENA